MSKKRVVDDGAFAEHVRTTCFSLWDGCACGEPKGHEGLHRCAAENCGDTWTEEQAAQWWVEMESSRAVEQTREENP